MNDTEILHRASAYVFKLFQEKLSKKLVFHTYKHTTETVNEARLLGQAHNLPPEQMEMLLLAAWLHDTGYVDTYEGHEENSARRAIAFLREQNYPEDGIAKIAACIRESRIEDKGTELLAHILLDADLAHLGKDSFEGSAELLRVEWEIFLNRFYSDFEWAQVQLDFLQRHAFRTQPAQERFEAQREINIQRQREKLKKTSKKQKETQIKSQDTYAQPKRGIETMFRSMYQNHMELSAMADNKANMMISLNAIIMSVIITYLGAKTSMLGAQFTKNPILLVPVGSLLLATLGSVIFAILSAQPEVTSFAVKPQKVINRKINMLFFGNFTRIALEDFQHSIHEIMRDKNTLYNNMITDIYYLGEVLKKKYSLLRVSYTIFMFGLILTVLSFIVAMVYKI
ncbi:metal-dependent phosphohydrolase [Adhaeribacter sp. BT258]|uniref:Metal-dependent phosphohydrolase n=1 Tax=Adhaeribacter terrigena TaxID=2793070 RepID=A0ABS1C223_9BACT|nr:Pycsar system effector family protein [Adhaeribacter terrigena]MBK0403380.1 metal-dependent phosphohydrolase [Adhaeribacter terrigena]